MCTNYTATGKLLFIFHCILVIEACEAIVLSIEKVFNALLLRDASDWALYATTL